MPTLFTYFRSAPKFSAWHSHRGQESQVLITAGVDGDEYAGILAAKTLIHSYNLNIPITIIPIVNLAGYQAKTSHNPLDGHHLKSIFPGSHIGSSSARLMHEVSKHVRGKKLWIDLHGGASKEHLIPFIWAGGKYPVLSHLVGRILVENSVQKNIPYIMLESGELGQKTPKAIKQHLDWVYSILKNLDKPLKEDWQPTYTKVKYTKYTGQQISKNTLWYSPNYFFTGS